MTKLFKINGNKISKKINGHPLSYHVAKVKINHLNFWKGNPRIYTRLRIIEERGDKDINKETIFNELRKMPEFNKLLGEVKQNGSIYDPLWVGKDINSDDYIVYEGNTRLAVAMLLFRNHEKNFEELDVHLYTDDTSLRAITNHVIGFHIKGKAKWQSFEAHGMFYREVINKIDEFEISKRDAFKLVAEENSMKSSEIEKAFELISFLEKNKIPMVSQKNQISYFQELLRPLHKKTRAFFNNPGNIEMGMLENVTEDLFDKKIIQLILDGKEVKRVSAAGVDGAFRDHLTLISKGFNEQGSKEHIYKLLSGEYSIQTAAAVAQEGGAGDSDFKNIKDFSDLINDRKTKEKIMLAKKKYPEIDNFLLDIVKAIKEIRIDLSSLKEKSKKLAKK